MEIGHLHYLPICMSVWFLLTFVLTYIISVAQKDVEPFFPYISDTGTFTPTSCIFGQLLNTGSILLSITIYIRYLQIKQLIPSERTTTHKWNVSCVFVGWLAALGVGIVGNFQETEVFSVHIIGALMAFGLAAVYQFLDWRISKDSKKECAISNNIVNFRLVLSLISATTFCTCFGFAGIALLKFNGGDMTKWKKSDGGYSYHLVSTITEWICGITTMTYIYTFAWDFKHFKISEPVLTFNR